MDKRKKMLMIVAVILAVLLIVPLIVGAILTLVPSAQAAVTQSDIDAIKGRAQKIEAEKKGLNEELARLKKEKAGAVEQKNVYDRKIEVLNEEIENRSALIAGLDQQIIRRDGELREALSRQAEGREQFEARVAAMQRMGSSSYWGVLLEAESFADFLARWEVTRRLVAYDNELAEEYREACVSIEAARAALDEDRRAQEEGREGLTAAQADLAVQSAEADALIAGMMAEISSCQKILDEQELAEKEAQKEIARLQAELKRQIEEEMRRQGNNGGHAYVGGQYMWPVPGHTNISSGYGWRVHPVYKVKRHHNGIDIPAPRGSRVVAANSGTVISRAYNSGYGNYIVIDHGGGQATLYGHLNGFAGFQAGSRVSRGDTIGYVGTTGVSTGYHLHFEIIKNGAQVNPEPLLRG